MFSIISYISFWKEAYTIIHGRIRMATNKIKINIELDGELLKRLEKASVQSKKNINELISKIIQDSF